MGFAGKPSSRTHFSKVLNQCVGRCLPVKFPDGRRSAGSMSGDRFRVCRLEAGRRAADRIPCFAIRRTASVYRARNPQVSASGLLLSIHPGGSSGRGRAINNLGYYSNGYSLGQSRRRRTFRWHSASTSVCGPYPGGWPVDGRVRLSEVIGTQ